MGPTVMAELMIPLLSQPYTVVLSATVQMWDMGCILGAKMWIWSSRVSSSKSFVFKSPCRAWSVTSLLWISWERGERQTNHFPDGYFQTSSIPVTEASVAPTKLGGKGSSSCKWVGLELRSPTRLHYATRLLCAAG